MAAGAPGTARRDAPGASFRGYNLSCSLSTSTLSLFFKTHFTKEVFFFN